MNGLASNSTLLEFKNVSKAFGDCVANKSVSFTVHPGSIHALVGENGAGKSTIMKIFFGLFQRDGGDVRLNGQSIDFTSPLEAKKHGIGMVHQHFMLAGPLTALEHIFLDESKVGSLFKPLDKTGKLQELEVISEKYKMPVAWNEKIENLSVGFQQRIEILKLLFNKANILILDEPTAVLTPQETEALFSQLRELKASGKTILLITHKLKEVMALADQVTVFRHGETIQSLKVSETSPQELSELMVGRKLQTIQPSSQPVGSKVRLELNALSVPSLRLKDLSFQVHHGEILGIAGIEGNGQSELIEYLLDPERYPSAHGSLELDGKNILEISARELKNQGVSYFPEDRLRHGALTGLDLRENFLLGLQRLSQFQSNGILHRSEIQKQTDKQIRKFDVRPADSTKIFQRLSGGNQQKLVVARELFRNPKFLLAAQPTRGVDIGAMERIHLEMLEMRNQGGSILLISSDLDELMKLSDQILVFYQGKIVGEMAKADFDELKLGHFMTGVHS